jgi:ubiquinone/menaquinone biosynthesis C-methylase UbiE
MLPRVLEPEVMESAAEARDYDAMDHSAANTAFVADFFAVWDQCGPVLDVGTGPAQIPVALCQKDPAAQVVGIDLSEQMLALGLQNVRKSGLEKRIHLERCDAKYLPYETGCFGAVISNSIVHHILNPGRVLAEMVRVLAPAGVLFVRDLLRPADDKAVWHLVATYVGEANAHQQEMFEDSLRASLTLEEIRRLVEGLGFDPEEVRQTTDRHWTWQTRKPGTAKPKAPNAAP